MASPRAHKNNKFLLKETIMTTISSSNMQWRITQWACIINPFYPPFPYSSITISGWDIIMKRWPSPSLRCQVKSIRHSSKCGKIWFSAQLSGRKGGSTFLTEMELSFGPTWHIPRTPGKNKWGNEWTWQIRCMVYFEYIIRSPIRLLMLILFYTCFDLIC